MWQRIGLWRVAFARDYSALRVELGVLVEALGHEEQPASAREPLRHVDASP